MPTIELPSLLSPLAQHQPQLIVPEATTLQDVFNYCVATYPALKKYLLNETHHIPAFLSVYINQVDVRELQGLATPLTDQDVITLVPALAGG